jgi:hypothetical protein
MEDYLCSSCTHVRGSYNFSAALDRLEIASKLGMLESAVKMEQILMRNTPPRTTNAEELQLGKTIPKTCKTAKKPGQRKRVKSLKTMTRNRNIK